MAGTLAAGTKIAEQATAERLGVSRVPVREAAIALERCGLLVRSPTGRLRVPALTERDMAELLEVRQFIEPELVRMAAERHGPDDIAAIERNLAGLRAARDLARVSLCDAEFHDLVAAASHQPRLIQVWELLRGQFLLWIACSQRRLGRTAEDIRRTTLAHHSAIVSLIRSRDSEGAVRYVRDLLEVAAHEMRDALARDVRSRR